MTKKRTTSERVVENASLVGLSRQVALRRELDVIANNVANMNTSGFKAEQMVFGEYLGRIARDDSFQQADRPLSFVEDRSTWHDFSSGSVQSTGGQTDFAIDGDGFFAVQTRDGVRYTRNGSFQVSANGTLVTSEGAPVLSSSGPITLGPTEHGLSVAADGTISTNEGIRGKLRVARFSSMQALTKDGSSLFSATETPTDATPRARVLQGAIEKSNVKPILEMSRLVEVTRAYENVSAMLQKQDEMLRTAVERLADVPS